ncbi:MAG: biopolymer transporter ExbD [Flavobacteriales bacterium]|nr:biopolymer transporter ExbD [Flavobacteriales bacterium]
MSKFKKKKGGALPAISTASLPDIVFMLLFFFMTATTMKDSDLIVENRLPDADQVTKLEKKDRIMYIYAGKPTERYVQSVGSTPRIQLNDKFASVQDIKAFILAERAARNPELERMLITSLKVDKNVKMGLVSDIKQELRKVEALKINYNTNRKSVVE